MKISNIKEKPPVKLKSRPPHPENNDAKKLYCIAYFRQYKVKNLKSIISFFRFGRYFIVKRVKRNERKRKKSKFLSLCLLNWIDFKADILSSLIIINILLQVLRLCCQDSRLNRKMCLERLFDYITIPVFLACLPANFVISHSQIRMTRQPSVCSTKSFNIRQSKG